MIGLDNHTGPVPALTARDIAQIQAMRAMRPRPSAGEIGRAFGVTSRTVYRYLQAELVTAYVAGWDLTFLVRNGQRPVLLEGRPAPVTESEERLLDGNR